MKNANEEIYMTRKHWEQEYRRKYEARLRRQRKRKMINTLKVCGLCFTLLVGAAIGGTCDYEDRTGCSTYKGIVLEDEVGAYVRLENGQEFYVDDDEYNVGYGDKVYVELYKNGTNNYFRDDPVVKVNRRIF